MVTFWSLIQLCDVVFFPCAFYCTWELIKAASFCTWKLIKGSCDIFRQHLLHVFCWIHSFKAVNFLNHDKHFEMSNVSCVRGYQVKRGHVMNFKAEKSVVNIHCI